MVDETARVIDATGHRARREVHQRRKHRRDEVISGPEAERRAPSLGLDAPRDLPLALLPASEGLDEDLLQGRELVDRLLEGADRLVRDPLAGSEELARVHLHEHIGRLRGTGAAQRATGQGLQPVLTPLPFAALKHASFYRTPVRLASQFLTLTVSPPHEGDGPTSDSHRAAPSGRFNARARHVSVLVNVPRCRASAIGSLL